MPSSLARKPLPSYPRSNAAESPEETRVAPQSISPGADGAVNLDTAQPTLRCRQCGAGVALQTEDWAVLSEGARNRVRELEGEVTFLTGKATTAADKIADYEDEISKLKAAQSHAESHQHQAGSSSNEISMASSSLSEAEPTHKPAPLQLQSPTPVNPILPSSAPATIEDNIVMTPVQPASASTVATVTAPAAAMASSTARPAATLGRSLTTTRITNFLAARRFSPAGAEVPKPSTPTPPETTPDLSAALTHEQHLRKQAESKLKQTNLELEELSVSLFQQANEMVAAERKARVMAESKLEAKAAELEARSAMMEKRGTELERSHSELERKGEEWERKGEQFEKRGDELEKKGDTRDKASEQRTKALEKRCKWLEERVKVLEARDKEKGVRLEKLEKAMGRVGRVKGLLGEGKAG
ncbi:MAG: hypothetical protein M1828_000186 [Chrysothrix sp. TS-e1954]|nr:MAG: hypothetical protein M1828_000186 [Chrysothrix sp. TS-e1954]